MKVLHLISGGDSGGAKTHVFALLDQLKELADVTVACFMDGSFYKEILNKDIKTKFFEQKNRFDISVVEDLCAFINSEKFDLIHSHGARANFIAMFLKRKLKMPVVTTMHSDYKLDFTDDLYKKYVFTSLNAYSLRKLDYYIAVSDNFKKMLISRGFEPNKIFTVYNGMDYTKEAEYISKEDFAKRHGLVIDENEVYVGIIGRLDDVKGHDVFINAAAKVLEKCPNVTFLLAGDGDNKDKLELQAKNLGIGDKVKFLGFISDIYSFINFVDINTLSSRSESFPYVLMEGAFMKKATVSSDVGGISDLIDDGENGFLFENENYSQLADKLVCLVKDKEKRARFGEELFIKATTNFSSQKLAQTHMEIYNSILSDFNDDKKFDVVMSGYYGFRNSGDDALLFAIIDNLKKYKPNIRIAVLSARPKSTKIMYGVDAYHRFNYIQLKKVLKRGRVFVNGGGSLIQDATSNQSLIYYLSVMKLAKRYGLKVVLYANGIGPLKDKNISKVKKVLDKAEFITLRDKLSFDELKRIGVDKKVPVTLSADPVLTMTPSNESKTNKILESIGMTENDKYVVICLRSWQYNDPDFEVKLAGIADYICEQYHLKILFMPMKHPDDFKISNSIAALMKNKSYTMKDELEVHDFMGVISKCRFIIAMRLHSLIYAATCNVPSVAVSYDPKINGFMEYIGLKTNQDAKKINTDEFKNTIDEIMRNLQTDAKPDNSIFAEKALQSAKMTVDLLNQ